MPAKARVFISYARSDGLDFSRRLRAWLEEKEIPLSQDLVSLVGGEDFLLQIYKAIDQVEFLTLVMTPRAVASDNVRKEWRYARQRGVCVFPVVVPEIKVDFASLPHWMSSANWYDLSYEEQWTKLLNDLSRTCKTPRVPFMVEDLPENFVQRPVEFDALVSLLRNPKREEPIAMTAALRGAGGFGKTTLGRALCHDEGIQEAFDDGILWVTLGENPGDLKLKVLDLVEVLSGDRPGFDTVEAASTRLAELLADRDILMVVDDVWDAAHLAPFLRDPPRKEQRRCARLITTRNRDTLPSHARAVDVDAMRPNEAVDLLGAGLPDGHEGELELLARRLGEWPVLLKLANGVVRDRVRAKEELAEALEFVNADLEENGLATFDRPFDATDPRQRDHAVAATLVVSLKRLDEAERARYRELAVFPEDVDIPLSTLERLWGKTGSLSRIKVQKLCERLDGFSLLLRFDLGTRTIRLHDVMRSYLSRELKDSTAPHATLVDAWGDPHHLPDVYAWRWIAFHLAEAGRKEELRKLLLDFNWVQAKLEKTDVTALVSDYDHLVPFTDSAGAVVHEKHQGPIPCAPTELLGEPIGIPRWRYVAPGFSSANVAASFGKKPPPHSGGALKGGATEEPHRLVQAALRLSAHVVAFDKMQLAGQLLGRLLWSPLDRIQAMLKEASQWKQVAWLRPVTASLTPPGGPLLRTLPASKGCVKAVTVTPDGRLAISGGLDKTVKVWDLETGKCVQTLRGHTEHVSAVAVTGDGRRAVSGSFDHSLRVWDLESGTELQILRGHRSPVTAVAVTPDNRCAVSGSCDQTVRVWDLETGVELHTLSGHNKWVTALAVTPDGGRVISGSGYNSSATVEVPGPTPNVLKVWSLETGEVLLTLSGHAEPVTAVAVTPDGRCVVSGSWDNTVKLWDLETGAELGALKGHTRHVTSVAVTPDGRVLSASEDYTIRVWSRENRSVLLTLRGHTDHVNAVVSTSDGHRAVSGSDDLTIKIWNLESEDTQSAGGWCHNDAVMGVAQTPDGRRTVSCSRDNTLKVWSTHNGTELRTLRGHEGPVRCVAVLPDGLRAISASDDNTVRMWDLESGGELRALRASVGRSRGHELLAFEERKVRLSSLAVLADGRHAVSGSDDGTLGMWDLERGHELHVLGQHHGDVTALAVAPQGGTISACSDSTLKVWDLDRRDEVLTLTSHTAWIEGVAVTPDGQRAISCSRDHTLKLWDLKSGTLLATFGCQQENPFAASGAGSKAQGKVYTSAGHTGSVTAVSVMPDGERAVSTSRDHTIRVWDLETGKVIARFSADVEVLACVAAADGVTIVAGDALGRMHFLRLEEPVTSDKSRVGRLSDCP